MTVVDSRMIMPVTCLVKYGGMQALLRRENPLAFYIPCTAHSLNLVGVSAVDCCIDAVSFFGFVQALYTFFCFNSPMDGTIRLFVTFAGKEPHGKVFVRDHADGLLVPMLLQHCVSDMRR